MSLKKQFLFLTILFTILSYNVVLSQNNVGLKFFGVVGDFSDNKIPEIMTTKLDESGKYLIEPGAVLSYEHFSSTDDLFSLKFYQGAFVDATGQLSGFTHLGLRRAIFQLWKHSITIGFGPTLMYQQDRSVFPQYVPDEDYQKKNEWEYRIAWLSGEFEYNYYINKKLDISLSFFPVHKMSYTFSLGLKYWFSRSSGSDCNCPGFGKKNKWRKKSRRR